MSTKNPFSKTYTSPSEHVLLLQSRGLTIEDKEKAQNYIQHIGYYRLSAYYNQQNEMCKVAKTKCVFLTEKRNVLK